MSLISDEKLFTCNEMTDTFYHEETGQALRILGYDESKSNNVRYKAVVND